MKTNTPIIILVISMVVHFGSIVQAQQGDIFEDNRPVVSPTAIRTINSINIQDVVISKKNARLTPKETTAVQLAEKWQKRKIMPVLRSDDGSISFAYGMTMPTLICSPMKVCVIKLGVDEKIIEKPRCGDTARWEVTPSKSSIKGRQPHIFVKPFDSGLTSNLAVVTDKRTYTIQLKSRNDKFTPMISFRYPEEEDKLWQTLLENQQVAENNRKKQQQFTTKSGLVFQAENLDFDYKVKGDSKWRPKRVFNDGVKTYIQMPKSMKVTTAPILLTINQGKESLVNYRLKRELFVVDQLFDSAVLISGVGSKQSKIEIERIN